MVSAQVRCEQARFAMERGLSQRRACALMQVSRSSLSYTLKMPSKNAPVTDAMRALSGQFPRFGSRRIRVLLGREGIVVDRDRCASGHRRVYKCQGNVVDAAWQAVDQGLMHRQFATRYGAMTSYSMPVQTASKSNA